MPPNTSAPSAAGAADRTAVGELCFRVEIPGVEIGRFAECTGLGVEYEVMEYPEGGNNAFVHRLRGRARYPSLVLRRGLTDEDALLRWFFTYQKDAQRPAVTITLMDQGARDVRRFTFDGAFPIRWSGPNASAGSSASATESLEIGHTGLVW